MLRDKYSFPELSAYVEEIQGKCFECLVVNKSHHQEPTKMTAIPEKPWQRIAADFSGPYPNGHYNLVVVDKQTRYPEVVTTPSTACQPTTE